MKRQLILFTTLILFTAVTSVAQTVTGFWGVDEVTVGDRVVTPVAKWFRYEKDFTYRSGNGWTQNDVGSWTFNERTQEFLPMSKRGAPDEFGAFKVSFTSNGMLWEREEEGMPVVVRLSRIEEMPMSPADRISGRWDLLRIEKNALDITSRYDPDDLKNLKYGVVKPTS